MNKLKDGEPCGHPGCLHHSSHPCEGCGRVNGVRIMDYQNKILRNKVYEALKILYWENLLTKEQREIMFEHEQGIRERETYRGSLKVKLRVLREYLR